MVIFDKTGTLTRGSPSGVRSRGCTCTTEDDLIARAAAPQDKAVELETTVAPGGVIGEVIPAQSESKREVGFDLPVVLSEETKRVLLSAENHLAVAAGKGIVGAKGLLVCFVLNQVKQGFEGEAGPNVVGSQIAVFDGMVAVVSELEGVSSVDAGQDRTPIVVGAAEFARRPTSANVETLCAVEDRDGWPALTQGET